MKIFISHSSADKEYGEALVDLLVGLGIKDSDIIFTSNTAYGIPMGKNIFDWLKNKITEKPFVIYLLSADYYSSIACLNEMGAAWVVENEHALIFRPDFDLESKEFRSGAIDPREIGFFLNNEERLYSFIEQLNSIFDLSPSALQLSQKVKRFLKQISSVSTSSKPVQSESVKTTITTPKIVKLPPNANPNIQEKKINLPDNHTGKSHNWFNKLTSDVLNSKLSDEELSLVCYASETGNAKLKVGWQTSAELENIRAWEEINGFNNFLSSSYDSAIRKLALRKIIEESDHTGYGNVKEYKFKEDIAENIMDLPNEVIEKIELLKNQKLLDNNPLPF